MVLSDSVNVAVGKTASHSLTLGAKDASNAIDGDFGTFSHTADNGPDADWLEIDLEGLYSIDTFIIHNRWCQDSTDQAGCLCRLSGAMLILTDEEGTAIASAQLPDSCKHKTITISYMPHCPAPTANPTTSPSASPTPKPTKLPTSAPTMPPTITVTSSPTVHDPNLSETTPEYWYPDIDMDSPEGGNNACVHGSEYHEWMALPHYHSSYLFGSKNACCCRHECDDHVCVSQSPPQPVPEPPSSTTTTTTTSTTTTTKESFWYPDLASGNNEELNCIYGNTYLDFMLNDQSQFLFESEEECCLNNGPCQGWFWYPNTGALQKQCHFGNQYPSWMEAYDNLLSLTEEECCAGECVDDETS